MSANDLNTPLSAVALSPELDAQAQGWPAKARALVITTIETCRSAGEMLTGIKALRKVVADTFDPHVQRAHEAHKALLADKAKNESPLIEAEGILKRGLAAYDTQMECVRREEQIRLEREAREREEQQRLNDAAALEVAGLANKDPELLWEAQELLAQPPPAPVVIVQKATPRVSGISYTLAWKYRITNPLLLPKEFTKPDDVKIGQHVRAHKGDTKIPGVQVWSEKGVSAGAR